MKNTLLVFENDSIKVKGNNYYENIFLYTNYTLLGKYDSSLIYNKGDIVYNNTGQQNFFILEYPGKFDLASSFWLKFYDDNTYILTKFINFSNKNEFWLDLNDNWYKEISLDDNIRLDTLAYINYNTKDTWDVLFLMNNMSIINELPSSTDIIDEEVDIKLHEWANLFNYTDLDFQCLDVYINEGKWGYYDDNGVFHEITDETKLYYLNKLYDAYVRINKEIFTKNEKYRIFKLYDPAFLNDIKESYNAT